MATRPKIGEVDRLLDDVSEIGVDLHGLSADARCSLTKALHELVKVLNVVKVVEVTTKPADIEGQGGGELYDAVAALRAAPAIRRATPKPRSLEEVAA